MIRKILKRLGLMKISDAKLLSVAIERKRLENLKQWIKEDAPDIYRLWKDTAEEESEQWIADVFANILESEWFVRKGK